MASITDTFKRRIFLVFIGISTLATLFSSQVFSQEQEQIQEEQSAACLPQNEHKDILRDDAPPFTDAERKKFTTDPDHVHQVVGQLIASRTQDENDEQFLERFKRELHKVFPYIDLKAKKYRNKYHGVVGDIYVLFATPWEYMILFNFRELKPQAGRGFWNNLSKETQQLIEKEGLGFSGRYSNTAFRTIPVIGDQVTITEDEKVHIHHPGERAFLPASKAKFYKSGWILECAHGQLWKAFPRFIRSNHFTDVTGQMKAVLRGLSYRMKK